MKKIFTLLAIYITVLPVYPCGGGWDPESEYYSFFHQTIISDQTLYPFLYAPENRYYWGEGDEPMEDPNMLEWVKLVSGENTDGQLADLVYKRSLDATWAVNDAVHGIKNGETTDLAGVNWRKSKNQQVLNYLIFAKKCEKQSRNPEYGWYYADNVDPADQKALLDEGLELYKLADSKELKLRYGYQLVRLAHYSGQYEKAIDLFEKKVAILGIKNYMYYRALEQEAGAINFTDPAKAAYLFSIVFDKLPDRRVSCMNSFSFTSQRSWDAALAHCKTAREKAVFHVMRAFKQYGDEVSEMEKVANLDPGSEFLELMLARRINQTEREVFPVYYDSKSQNFPGRVDAQREIEMIAVILDNPNLKNRDMWIYGLGFFQLVSGDFEGTRTTLERISPASELSNDAFALLYILKLMEVEELNAETEVELWEAFNKDGRGSKCGDLRALMMSVFSSRYAQQGDDVKAYLCSNSIAQLQEGTDLEFLEKLERFYARTDLNSFEKYIGSSAARQNGLNEVRETKGNLLLKNGKYEAAVMTFEQLNGNIPDNAYFSNERFFQPHLFGADVRHWYSEEFEYLCDKEYEKYSFLSGFSNKLELARVLAKLKKKAEQSGSDQASYYYLLGNATYNMSPYGWHRPVLHYREDNWSHSMNDNYPYELAQEYFEKAREISNNSEFKAKVTYMLAKVEVASSRYDYSTKTYLGITEDENYYFNQLKEDYSNTAYYNEIIRECSYFSEFVNN